MRMVQRPFNETTWNKETAEVDRKKTSWQLLKLLKHQYLLKGKLILNFNSVSISVTS